MKTWFTLLGLAAATLLASPALAQSVTNDATTATGNPGSVSVTSTTANRKVKVPAFVPVRADGSIIDPAGGGGGGTDPRVAQASTTSGQTGSLVQGAVTTAAPTYTTGTTNPFSLNTAGGLRIDNTTLSPGASTLAAQNTGNTSLTTIAGTVATVGATASTTAQQMGGLDTSGFTRPLRTDTRGGLVPGQGVYTSTRTTLTASTATALEGAGVAGRIGQSVTTEAALAANVFLCTTQTTSCSATSYDAMIPSGAGAGTVYTFLFATTGRLYAFSTGTPVLVLNSIVAP